MARVLSFLIRYFSNYYALHRSDLAARAAPLDPRLRGNYDFSMFQVRTPQKHPLSKTQGDGRSRICLN